MAREMAGAGASQQRVIERLERDFNVRLGAPRLRRIVAGEAEERAAFRHVCQVACVLELLKEADESSGNRKPVLAVGRDGVTVCNQPHGFWEVGSSGTVTVYDRSGKRLGTVYLAQMPESLQVELTQQLRQLIVDVLKECNRLPRLCYVTDAGDNESNFYNQVLRHLRDPREGKSRQRLKWTRIVDYYHATERITVMAEQLFGKKEAKQASAWARRMRKLLLQPNGPSRVLHAAAALRARRELSQTRADEYSKAYEYLRKRTRCMQYHDYRRQHLPIGSSVTEAACKTIFGQRLKLSGMRWKKPGGQAILDLRVILLSGIWTQVRDAALRARKPHITLPYRTPGQNAQANAA
ncbi:transposase [Planctomycetota bacterium]